MDTLGKAQRDAALTALGELLAARGAHYEVVLVGGGNLILTGDDFAYAFDRWLVDFVEWLRLPSRH